MIEPVLAPTFSAPVKPTQKSSQHLGILDLLRGIAALLVVFYHYTYSGMLSAFKSPLLDSIFTRGYLGVEIFFVISGFIIPYSIWGKGYSLAEFWPFMRKRLVRICPPAYASLLLTLAQWAILDHWLATTYGGKMAGLSTERMLRNFGFSYGFLNNNWINLVFWTLTIEFQFYFLVGLCFNYLFNSTTVRYFLIIFLALSACTLFPSLADHTIFAFASLFALGGATLLFYKRKIKGPVYSALLALFTVLAAVLVGFTAACIGLLTAITIAFLKVRHRLFEFFGGISYSLYLTHLVVGETMNFLLPKVLHPATQPEKIGCIMLCVVVAIGVAYIFTITIERPFMLLARRMKL